MTKQKLHGRSHAVVHHTKHRTRLRVPKNYRKHDSMSHVQSRIEKISGVQSVVINSQTGSVLVQHEEKPGLLEEIGTALEESAPEILAAMLLPGGEEAEAGLSLLTSFVKKCFSPGAAPAAAGNGGASSLALSSDLAASGMTAREAVPLAFFAAGVFQLMKDEALLGSLAPLALFYYGFDVYWKLRQEQRTADLERMAHTEADAHKHKSQPTTKEQKERQ